jgi:hypothetical protein
MSISLAFEILVSLLLIVTIGYCFQLDRRLKALRTGQDGVRQSITDLVQATIQAEQSVKQLTKTGELVTQELEDRIIEAKSLARKLGTGNALNTPVSAGRAQPDRIAPLRPNLARPAPVDVNSDAVRSSLMQRLKQAG